MRTMDHELIHYVQLRMNKKLRWFNLLSVDKRKIFVEGFAEFVTSLTRKNSPGKKVSDGIARMLEGKKVGGELEYYVKGYLAFRLIAEANSIEQAIRVGMTSNFSGLRKESRELCTKHGIPYYI